MSKIFISSTSLDLVKHRAAVLKTLEKAGHDPIAMEEFGAQPKDAETVSRDEVLRADLFVGIYGHRYGYRPDNGKSVTEQEYWAARDSGMDCLIFIVEADYREGLLGEHAETKQESIDMLAKFKKHLEAAHVRDTFTTPDDLAARVTASVAKWRERQMDAQRSKSERPDSALTPFPFDRARDPGVVQPSNLDDLVQTLLEQQLVILAAPAQWGVRYVVEHLALRVGEARAQLQNDGQVDEAARVEISAYELTKEISAAALLDVLRNTEERRELTGGIIVAFDVDSESYRKYLTAIIQAARDRSVYVILTTQKTSSEWGVQAAHEESRFVWLPESSPYAKNDLTLWLVRELNQPAVRNHLRELGVVAADEVTARTRFEGWENSVADWAIELGSIGKIDAFVTRLRSVKTVDKIEEAFQSAKREDKPNLKKWFDELESEEQRYLVLTISLVDGLPQETFWAIYEHLTQYAWRQRLQDLSMADYYDIQANLVDYIDAQGDYVRFYTPRDRANLVEYALNSYRRSLVQALPYLARIFTHTDHVVSTHGQAVETLLREMAIFGSYHEGTEEMVLRQNRLRNSLASSIAQIALREPRTTEDLLLWWARSDGDEETSDTRLALRLAVSSVLLQMYLIEQDNPPTTEWYKRYEVFSLLDRWYRRYYIEFDRREWALWYLTGELSGRLNEYANIRSTMIYALCEMSRYMPDEIFDSTGRGIELLREVPPVQPAPGEISSPWEMLVALAWDPTLSVRASVINGLVSLRQRRPLYAERLLMLLAGDRNRDVLVLVARYLFQSYVFDDRYLPLIFSMLAPEDQPYFRRDVPSHLALLADITADSGFYPSQWVAAYTLFLSGLLDPEVSQAQTLTALPVFNLYLKAWLTDENSSQFKAFEDVLELIVRERLDPDINFSKIRKWIEVDKTAEKDPTSNTNPYSPAARLLTRLQGA